MLKTRVISSVVGIALLLVMLFFFDTIVINIFITSVCILAMHELYTTFNLKHKLLLHLALTPLAIVAFFAPYKLIQLLMFPIFVYCLVFIALFLVFNFEQVDILHLGAVVTYGAIIVFSLCSINVLKALYPSGAAPYVALYCVVLCMAVAWGGDTAAYFVGIHYGKKKLIPSVSPKKTVEGFFGGLAGSVILGQVITLLFVFVAPLVLPSAVKISINIWGYLLCAAISLVGSCAGVLGDLFASAIKRNAGLKDFGTVMPGHGGILDRIDSLIFVMPVITLAAIAIEFVRAL